MPNYRGIQEACRARLTRSLTLLALLALVPAPACGSDGGTGAGGGSGGGSGAGGGSGVGGGGGSVSDMDGSVAGGGGGGGTAASDWAYDPGAPLDDAAPSFGQANHPLAPTALWGDLDGPYPTNAFWSNLVLGDGTERINAMPYHLRASDDGIGMAMPALAVDDKSITTSAAISLVLGAEGGFTNRAVVDYDLFGVTLEMRAGAGSMRAPIVYGMPYVTGIYDGLTPHVGTGGPAVVSVNGAATTPVTGTRFEVAMNNGETWILYASAEITFAWNGNGLTATGPFDGRLRAALRPSGEGAAVLDAHAGAVPVGAELEASITGHEATIGFAYETVGDGSLLMMAMPHHLERLSGATAEALEYPTLFGAMKGVTGTRWDLAYALPDYDFRAPRPIDPARVEAVRSALMADASYVPDAGAVGNDPYFGGKQLAKLARLVLIAEELGEDATAEMLAERLEPLVVAWLEGTNGNPLVYDTTWGGLVTTNGVGDASADFGQGYYNDHHFHYGYHLYAAAVLAHRDPAFHTAHGAEVLMLARDVLNPSAADASFPRFRNFDFFVSHSWAAGLFVFGDGRNQESTAEAVNAWYGAYLYGLASGESDLEAFGRILLAMESVGAQTYWQVESDSTIYPEPFRSFGAVGVLWETKVDAVTFFGANPEFVYGIQMIPFTPASETLLDPAWVADVWPKLEAAADGTMSDGWAGFMHLAHAVVDPDAAWTAVDALGGFDDGNSKTNSLYFIATRP